MSSFQQHELALDDEAFALLDGCDLVVSAYDTTCAASFSSFTYSNTSTGSSNASPAAGHENTTDVDDALLALLADSELSEFALPWDAASPRFFAHVEQQNEFASPPTAARATKPQSKKTKNKKAMRKDTATASALVAPTAVTKRPRKHNRLEILKLKQELEELQAQFSSLQLAQKRLRPGAIAASNLGFVNGIGKQESAATNSSQPGTLTPHSPWFKHAEEQYKALQQSEVLNRRLRSAVAQQQSVMNSLQALFQNKVSPQDLDFLQRMPATAPSMRAPQHPSPRDQLLARLHGRLESLYGETDTVCERISLLNDTKTVFTVCQTKQDTVRGPVFEFTTNTPIASDFRAIGRLLWSSIVENKDPAVVRSLNDLELAQKHFPREVHQKHMEMSVPSDYGTLQVDGDVIFRKFEEDHRVVLIVSSACSVRNTGVVVDDKAWLVVSKVKDVERDEETMGPPAPAAALLQTFFRIDSEQKNERGLGPPLAGVLPFGASKLEDEKTRYLQEVVIQAMGDHMRVHMAELQTSLLSEAENLAASLTEFKCPMSGCTCCR